MTGAWRERVHRQVYRIPGRDLERWPRSNIWTFVREGSGPPMGENMWQMRLVGWDLEGVGGAACMAASRLACCSSSPRSAAPAPTQLKLTGPAKAVPPGGKAKLTATLTAAGKPLTGKGIAFLSGADESGKATTDSKGRAQLSVKLDRRRPPTPRATRPPAPTRPPTPVAEQRRSRSRRRRASTVGIGSYLRAGRRAVGIPGSPVRVRGSAGAVRRRRAGRGLGVPRRAGACSTRRAA